MAVDILVVGRRSVVSSSLKALGVGAEISVQIVPLTVDRLGRSCLLNTIRSSDKSKKKTKILQRKTS